MCYEIPVLPNSCTIFSLKHDTTVIRNIILHLLLLKTTNNLNTVCFDKGQIDAHTLKLRLPHKTHSLQLCEGWYDDVKDDMINCRRAEGHISADISWQNCTEVSRVMISGHKQKIYLTVCKVICLREWYKKYSLFPFSVSLHFLEKHCWFHVNLIKGSVSPSEAPVVYGHKCTHTTTLNADLEQLQSVSFGQKSLCHIFAELLQFPGAWKRVRRNGDGYIVCFVVLTMISEGVSCSLGFFYQLEVIIFYNNT